MCIICFKIKQSQDKICLKNHSMSLLNRLKQLIQKQFQSSEFRLMTTYRSIICGSLKVGEQVTIQIQSLLSKCDECNSIYGKSQMIFFNLAISAFPPLCNKSSLTSSCWQLKTFKSPLQSVKSALTRNR